MRTTMFFLTGNVPHFLFSAFLAQARARSLCQKKHSPYTGLITRKSSKLIRLASPGRGGKELSLGFLQIRFVLDQNG